MQRPAAAVEWLEPRVLLAITSPAWVEQGLGPAVSGLSGGGAANTGAVNAIALLPANPDIAFIGGATGGVWRTSNFSSSSPTWTSLSDQTQFLAMTGVNFDPADPTGNTVYASTGQTSNTNSPIRKGVTTRR